MQARCNTTKKIKHYVRVEKILRLEKGLELAKGPESQALMLQILPPKNLDVKIKDCAKLSDQAFNILIGLCKVLSSDAILSISELSAILNEFSIYHHDDVRVSL